MSDPFSLRRLGNYEPDDEGGPPAFPWVRVIMAAVAFVAVVTLIGVGCGAIKSADRTGPTEVAVVYNGGPFDSKDQRMVVGPSSSWQIPGLYSTWRKYIHESEQRYYTIRPGAADADNSEAEVEVPTKDGVQVQIEGTTNFHTGFTGEEDDPNLEEFDQRFGNRKFGDKYVWEEGGWDLFLNAQVRPVLVSTFREEIGGLDCAELVSSCALIQQNTTGNGSVDGEVEDASGNFEQVATAVEDKLATRMEDALGGPYLQDFQVNIERVRLPEDVQTKINTAQAAFADVSTQRARAESAKFEAQRIRETAEALDTPGAAAVELAKIYAEACDSGATCVIDASAQGLGLNVGGR